MTLQNNRPESLARWDKVQIGDLVQLRRNGRAEHSGRVDDRTADGASVWVMCDPGHRHLFHLADGYELAAVDAVRGQS